MKFLRRIVPKNFFKRYPNKQCCGSASPWDPNLIYPTLMRIRILILKLAQKLGLWIWFSSQILSSLLGDKVYHGIGLWYLYSSLTWVLLLHWSHRFFGETLSWVSLFIFASRKGIGYGSVCVHLGLLVNLFSLHFNSFRDRMIEVRKNMIKSGVKSSVFGPPGSGSVSHWYGSGSFLVMSNQRFFKIVCFRFPTNVPQKIEYIRFWNKIHYRTKTLSFRFQTFRSKSN